MAEPQEANRMVREAIDRIEMLIQEEVGRNIGGLFAATHRALWHAASSLASAPRPSVAIMTGFFIPGGMPPAAETDGPVGAALLALGLRRVGVRCRFVTDVPCRSACAAALAAAGVKDMRIDEVQLSEPLSDLIAAWRLDQVSHVISIERCGKSADGIPRNMRGVDISSYTAPLDDLFLAGPWEKLAIGDGGNEIGMGSLPLSLIAAHVEHGEAIACVTPADHLIVAGVSNWGAWGLLAALAAVRTDWRAILLGCLDPKLDRAILEATVHEGPAVDGVSRAQTLTVDGLEASFHQRKLLAIRSIVAAMS